MVQRDRVSALPGGVLSFEGTGFCNTTMCWRTITLLFVRTMFVRTLFVGPGSSRLGGYIRGAVCINCRTAGSSSCPRFPVIVNREISGHASGSQRAVVGRDARRSGTVGTGKNWKAVHDGGQTVGQHRSGPSTMMRTANLWIGTYEGFVRFCATGRLRAWAQQEGLQGETHLIVARGQGRGVVDREPTAKDWPGFTKANGPVT